MKRVLLASAAAMAMAATTPAFADGEMTGCGCWYAGASVGGNWLAGDSVITFFSDSLEPKFDTGWAISAQVGYRFANGFRTEIEFAYRKNKADSIEDAFFGPVSSVDGDVSQTSLMANVLYDIRLTDDFALSLGAGVGAAGASVASTAMAGRSSSTLATVGTSRGS